MCVVNYVLYTVLKNYFHFLCYKILIFERFSFSLILFVFTTELLDQIKSTVWYIQNIAPYMTSEFKKNREKWIEIARLHLRVMRDGIFYIWDFTIAPYFVYYLNNQNIKF